MAETQSITDNRLTRVDYQFICDEGPDSEFQLHRFHLVEGVNETFEMRLELVTPDKTADVDQFLSASCELIIARADHMRSVFGIVSTVEYLGHSEDRLIVALTVVPACALLRQQTRSRMFQEMTVLEVIEEVLTAPLQEYGRTLDTGAASRGTSPRDYCVQYNESEWDFVVRLMEEEGISYRFEHDVDQAHEILTLFYANEDCPEVQNTDGSAMFPIIADRPDTAELESFQSFTLTRRVTTTSTWRTDYDFLTPTSPLEHRLDGADTKSYDRRIYTHLDRRFVADDVEQRNQDQFEAVTAPGAVVYAHGNAIMMEAGKVFELERHVRPDLEARFVMTRVIHSGECPEVLISSTSAGTRYTNRFQCQIIDIPVRPPQRTKKPRVLGPQTGIVSGPSGEEIHTDEHGRIMVQMHWEEERTYDDTSSCWIRVMQSWAGPGWGTQFIPRIGMEVVVSFLEGNPDRPMVTGCVYNGDNAPPFSVPDNKTQSGWRTDSVGGEGYNMIRFEDTSGSEEVFIHAQKDKNVTVLDNRSGTIGTNDTLTIGNDRTKSVGNDQSEEVGNDKTITVQGKHTETIHKDEKLTVLGNSEETVAKNKTVTITGKRDETIGNTAKKTIALKYDQIVGAMKSVKIGGLYSEQVGASRSITAVGAFSVTAGLSAKIQSAKAMTIKAQKKLDINTDDELTIMSTKAGKIIFKDKATINSGKKATIDVKEQLTIKSGGAKVVLKKDGSITVTGKKITIKGSGPVKIKGSKVDIN